MDWEELIPEDHLLRKIDEAVDFSFIYDRVEHLYSPTGRPSIDLVILFKMLLVGYLYGIPSERRLEEEVKFNLAYRWFLGLQLVAFLASEMAADGASLILSPGHWIENISAIGWEALRGQRRDGQSRPCDDSYGASIANAFKAPCSAGARPNPRSPSSQSRAHSPSSRSRD